MSNWTERDRAVWKRRRVLRQTGRPSLVDDEELLARVRTFKARGMTYRQMSRQTGVDEGTILAFATGGNARLRRSTQTGLLPLRFEEPAPDARVSPVGTRRRLQAMWAEGFTTNWIADQSGLPDGVYAAKLARGLKGEKSVSYATARAVAELYRRSEGVDPEAVGYRLQTVSRARGSAARHGFPPRYCWEEWTVDDPDAIPDWTGYCGTGFGMMVHRRDGIPVCRPCKAAYDPKRPYPGFSPEKLRKARERSGLTMKALEKLSGVSDKTVVTWESGRFTPGNHGTLDKVLLALDLTYEDVCDPVEGT